MIQNNKIIQSLVKLLNIKEDCLNISFNNELDYDFIGKYNFKFSLLYSEEETNNIEKLKEYGFEIYEDEDFTELLYNDNNRNLLSKIFTELKLDLIEFKGIYINNYKNQKILILDKIDFIYKFEEKNHNEEKIIKAFDMEKLGLTIDKINDNIIVFHFLGLSRRISVKGLNSYKINNVDLIESLDRRNKEVVNSDENRKNIINLINYILKINNINVNIKLIKFDFRVSEIIDGFYIDKIKVKIIK
jgi:hypothetical protein